MISTTSPTVRRWCVFCVTCRTSKTARKAHICGSSRVATLCVTSAPFSQRASGRGAAHAGASLPDSLPRSLQHYRPAMAPRACPSAAKCADRRAVGGPPPHVAYTPLHARQSLSAPGRVVLFHHRPRHRRVVLPVPLVYGPTTARALAAPNIFVSAQVAAWTDDKARYIRNRGLDDGYYRELIVDYLKRYGQASRQEIDALLLPKLPDVLDATQQGHKIRNLMQAMRREGIIYREGGRSTAIWRLAMGQPLS